MIQELEYVLSKHVTDIPTTTESPTTPKPDKIIDNSEHLLIQAETKVEQLDIMLTTIKDEMNIICDLLNILTLEVLRCTNLCRALHFSLYLKNALQLKPDFSRF